MNIHLIIVLTILFTIKNIKLNKNGLFWNARNDTREQCVSD